MNSTHLMRTIAAVGGLWLLASTASAQTLGTYEGLTSQGKSITLDVVDDGAGGNAFGGGLVFWDAECSKSGPGRGVAWGVGTNISAEFKFNMLYEKWKLTFAGTTVTGTFVGRTPEFMDVNPSTKSVELCDSGTLSFSATLVPPLAPRQKLAPGQAIRLQ